MFRTDVAFGEAQTCNTADALPAFDYTTAKDEWDALTEDEQSTANIVWQEFSRDNYSDLCKAFAEGRDAVDDLVSRLRG